MSTFEVDKRNSVKSIISSCDRTLFSNTIKQFVLLEAEPLPYPVVEAAENVVLNLSPTKVDWGNIVGFP